MNTQSSLAVTSIPNFLPVMRPLNPGHDISVNPDPPVLDLCIRKRPLSPNLPHDYNINKRSPSYAEQPYSSPNSRPQSRLSETSEISSSEGRDLNSNYSTKMKPNRPFKAYPKDPLSVTLIGTPFDILRKDPAEAYAEFRQKMLAQVQMTHNGTNKNMRRTQSQNTQNTDPTYWEKRKKNNEAAKRSRDARRAKEDEIAVRCAYLEQENYQLRFRLAALESEREQISKLKFNVYH